MRDTAAGRELLEREMLSKPVSSLQYMLRQLSKTYQFLPELAVDGVYGERTLEAVMRFQREAGLPVTGVVDQATWNAIHSCWLRQQSRESYSRATRVFPGGRSGPRGQQQGVYDRPPDHVQCAGKAL